MKIEFKNGSFLESVDMTSLESNVRGRRANYMFYQDVNLKWHQKVYLKIYARTIRLFTRLGCIKISFKRRGQ